MPDCHTTYLERALRGTITYVSGDDLNESATARLTDIAIAFGHQQEFDGMDLAALAIFPEQSKPIEAFTSANSKTIVVLETGSTVTMPWIDKVGGAVEARFWRLQRACRRSVDAPWMMAYSLGIQRNEPGFQKFVLQL